MSSNSDEIRPLIAGLDKDKSEKEVFWNDFKMGKGKIYLGGSGEAKIPGLPGFTCRKLKGDRLALLAWRTGVDAQTGMISLGAVRPVDEITEMDYAKLMELIGANRRYVIELI